MLFNFLKITVTTKVVEFQHKTFISSVHSQNRCVVLTEPYEPKKCVKNDELIIVLYYVILICILGKKFYE